MSSVLCSSLHNRMLWTVDACQLRVCFFLVHLLYLVHLTYAVPHSVDVAPCRGVGILEGLTWDSVSRQLQEGDSLSSNWRPKLGTDGTPNESSQDVLIRVRQVQREGLFAHHCIRDVAPTLPDI